MPMGGTAMFKVNAPAPGDSEQVSSPYSIPGPSPNHAAWRAVAHSTSYFSMPLTPYSRGPIERYLDLLGVTRKPPPSKRGTTAGEPHTGQIKVCALFFFWMEAAVRPCRLLLVLVTYHRCGRILWRCLMSLGTVNVEILTSRQSGCLRY